MSADLPEELLGIDDVLAEDEEAGTQDDSAEEEPEERERFLLFALGDRTFGVSVGMVRSIDEVPAYTRVPRTTAAIDGLADLRGEIATIINPRAFIDAAEPPNREGQRIVIFDRDDDEQTVGIRVDQVFAVEAVPVSSIVAPESVTNRLVSAIVRDVDGYDKIEIIDVGSLIDESRQSTA